MADASAIEVKPGQVWADNDWRNRGRRVRVERIEQGRAHCVVIASDPGSEHTIGRTTVIRVDRMRPTSTGYRLVEEADGD